MRADGKKRREPRRNPWVKLAAAAVWLLLWQAAYLAVGQDLLLSSPAAVFRRLGELVLTLSFWRIVLGSFLRIMGGFCLGVLLGAALGLATAFSPLLYEFLFLPMGIVKASPVPYLMILALVLNDKNYLSVFIPILLVVPLVWTNVDQGLRSADPKLLEMARVFRLSRGAVARHIYFPAALPYFLSACRTALGFAWKAGVAGEVIGIPRGAIGTQLYNAKIYLITVDLFAWTAVIILLSILIEKVLMAGLERAAGRWTGARLPAREEGGQV